MTTLVYRDGVLAADSQVNSGNGNRAGTVRKIGRTEDGHLWAFSGGLSMQSACVEWANGDRSGCPPEIDGVFVLIEPSGAWREWWGKGWVDQLEDYAAWGSGERIARGALFVGAGAEQACAAAIALDVESGGELRVERL